jgi:hypothetical protein
MYELMIEKKLGKLNGWVAYTLNKTQYKIEGINNGIYYSRVTISGTIYQLWPNIT